MSKITFKILLGIQLYLIKKLILPKLTSNLERSYFKILLNLTKPSSCKNFHREARLPRLSKISQEYLISLIRTSMNLKFQRRVLQIYLVKAIKKMETFQFRHRLNPSKFNKPRKIILFKFYEIILVDQLFFLYFMKVVEPFRKM